MAQAKPPEGKSQPTLLEGKKKSGAPKKQPGSAVHAEEVKAFLTRVAVSSTDGLSEAEAAERLATHGKNKLPEQAKKSAILRILDQFKNPLVLTLLAAAVIAIFVGFTGDAAKLGFLARFGDAIAILLIVVLNAFLGYYQERRAEAALDALQKLSAPAARVRRAGKVAIIAAEDVVPGDLLEIEAGDAIPADARLVQTIDLASEEASLTGESSAIQKDALAPVAEDAPLADRVTMIFTGPTIVRGKGRAIVTSTGVKTELGRIGEMIQSVGDQKTPLEERLEAFGKIILKVCLGLSVVLLAWGYARRFVLPGTPVRPLHDLLLEAVSLAVAAIPEGLPAITTITLALGMQRMAKRGAIVRRLAAVETLGAATIIASDKTGTLTQNEMTVRSVYTGAHAYKVTGEGYDPKGAILDGDGKAPQKLPTPLMYTLATAALCNNAQLEMDAETKQWRIVGDPTEGALLTLAAKGNVSRESMLPAHEVIAELPFDSDRKRMTVVTRDRSGRDIVHVKGSVDILLPRCVKLAENEGVRGLTDEDREKILAEADRMSASALRVLAICRRVRKGQEPPMPESGHPAMSLPPRSLASPASSSAEEVERELTFLGLVGMMDPPRAGVKEAVATCRRAGIRAVMITGDHRLTATAIAQEIGLWDEGDEAISGSELAELGDDELSDRIMHLRVFARTTAEQKLRIVRAFKAKGHVVAMTGDGVNDAPALREAHIGVAMGRAGTDVARQAADLVLADDNFATIVEAVREGRAIYRNIQKFIFFLLSSNMGLLVAVFVVSFFGKWPPLTPLMILWINLVTNGAPALALGMDPPDAHLMDEPPRAPTEGLLNARDYLGMLYVGLVMGGAAVFLYATSPQDDASLDRTRAVAFSLLALSPLFHAFSCRSPKHSLFAQKPFLSKPLLIAVAASAAIHLVAVLVPGLQPVFKTFDMSQREWTTLLLLSAAIIPLVEVAKIGYRAMRPHRAGDGPASSTRSGAVPTDRQSGKGSSA